MIEKIREALEYEWVRAGTYILLSLLAALVVRFIFSRVLFWIVGKTKTQLDNKLVHTYQGPVTFSVLMGGLWATWSSFRTPPGADRVIHGLMATLVILVWLVASLHFCTYLVNWLSSLEDRFRLIQPRTKPLFQMLFKLVLLVTAIYFVLVAWNQNVMGWLASAGVAGVAIGFAAKDTLANFFSGVFIIADAPYKIGDYIVLNNGDRGRVTDIGLRSTRLLTRDDVEVIIPNAIIGNSQIINQSGGPYEKFRLRVPVSVAYGSDIDLVRETLMHLALNAEDVVPDPRPRVRFRELGDSGLQFELLVWVNLPEHRGRVLDLLLSDIYKTFNEAGIAIPFPQMDVHLVPPAIPDPAASGET